MPEIVSDCSIDPLERNEIQSDVPLKLVDEAHDTSPCGEPISIESERVDDVPLLFAQLNRMGIAEILDDVLLPHGNRRGLSYGELTSIWLTYILSEADHRMNLVEGWAEKRIKTLNELLSSPVNPKDFTDDRLADVLRELSDDRNWQQIETQLGRRSIRVYNLEDDIIRLDSTSVYGYHDSDHIKLFRLGHSKDHRPDLPQFKMMLATLDPLGMPLATLTVAGNENDELLYLPAINEALKIVGCGGRLYIGDTKMATKSNRATIAKGGDYYLTVLTMTGKTPQLKEKLLSQFLCGHHQIEVVRNHVGDDPQSRSSSIRAIGFETNRDQQAKIENQSFHWQERVFAVYSPELAKTARQSLRKRLKRVESELLALTPPRGHGKQQWTDKEALLARVNEILDKHGAHEFFSIEVKQEIERRAIRGYKGRKPRYQERNRFVVYLRRNHNAIKETRQRLGWRLYATNAPSERLSLTKAVSVYKDSPSIERNFARLKGKSLGIRPLYVQREDHLIGLVRLLSLALRVLSLVEYVVRQRLYRTEGEISGLYAGNPRRKTQMPTTEKLLKAFSGITLTVIEYPNATKRHLTPLLVAM